MFEIITINELLKRLDKYNHKELHLHHTWKPVKSQFKGDNGIQLQESMRNHHVNTNGWSDIGQHVTLLPDGTFVTGRDFGREPASIQGYNTGAFACEILGNFDSSGTGEYNNLGYDVLEGIQKISAIRLAKYFNEKGKYVRFHRENSYNTCPGTSIDKSAFMQEVKSYGKKYYVVTNYIPSGPYGVEINGLIEKYFKDLERVYIKSNSTGMWIETQYLSKPEAEALAEKLKADNLLWQLVEE